MNPRKMTPHPLRQDEDWERTPTYQTEYDYNKERVVRHRRRDIQDPSYLIPHDYHQPPYDPNAPNFRGSREYSEELDRPYPRRGRKEVHPGKYEETERSYAGKGPRNYRRSDTLIAEEVNEMLTRHSSIDATDILAEVKDSEVSLTGTVNDRRMKHLAEEVAENCFGVRDVINLLRVKKFDAFTPPPH